ncbi:MAG: AAA family ATPase [Candidatus Acidiferrum sp.]
MNPEIESLKKSVGRRPFDSRLRLDSGGFCACPFHLGDSAKSMHLFRLDSGAYAVKCFSTCNKSWDAIAFVAEFDKKSKAEAMQILGGKVKTENAGTPTAETGSAPAPKTPPLSVAEYSTWGRALTPEDIVRFEKGRQAKGHTADFETWRGLGCRVKGDYLGFPYMHPSGEFLYTLKMRHLDRKEFMAENAASSEGFFNLDGINPLGSPSPVFIVEGEPDVAVLQEAGYNAVGILSSSQKKFDKHAIELISEASEIFIIGDQHIPKRGKDPDPGQATMDALEKVLERVAYKTHRMRFALDGTEREKELKDVSALRAHYGEADFEKRFEELQAKAREWNWIDENIPEIGKVSAEEQDWLVHRMCAYGCLSIVYGMPGAIKTMLAIHLASQICKTFPEEFLGRKITGKPQTGIRLDADGNFSVFKEEKTAPVKVLYIDRENPESEIGKRRKRLGMYGNPNFRYWGDWLSLKRPAEEPIALTPPGPDDPRVLKWAMKNKGLIIFDSLQQFTGDLDENSAKDMAPLMNKFKRLARQCAGVIILHHTAKPGELGGPRKDGRGSGAITAIPDMSFLLEKLLVDGQEVFRLGPGRFRCCENWLLTFRVNWNYKLGNDNYYQFIPISDQTEGEAAREERLEKEAKITAAQEKEASDIQKVNAICEANPENSDRTLADKLKMSPKLVKRLMDSQGWTRGEDKVLLRSAIQKPLGESQDEPY